MLKYLLNNFERVFCQFENLTKIVNNFYQTEAEV